MGGKSTPTRPIYADALARAEIARNATVPSPPKAEAYNRLERKDFWNDPERWDGIDDPHKTMIWEVRRPDRIDVLGKEVDDNGLRNMMAVEKFKMDAQAALAELDQSPLRYRPINHSSLCQYGNLFGGLFGDLFGY
jgi:hypothetical protein